jgi:hypothetical protein
MRGTLLSNGVTTMERAVSCRAYNGLVSDERSQYTHDEYCDMLLTLGSCKNPSSTNAREYALRHPGRCHHIAYVSQWRLHVTGSVKTFVTCECRSPTDRKDAKQ